MKNKTSSVFHIGRTAIEFFFKNEMQKPEVFPLNVSKPQFLQRLVSNCGIPILQNVKFAFLMRLMNLPYRNHVLRDIFDVFRPLFLAHLS